MGETQGEIQGTHLVRGLTVSVHKDRDGGFYALVPGLPGCGSQGETEDECLENVSDAIRAVLTSHPDEVGAGLDALRKENERLKARVMDLEDLVAKDEEALGFYADHKNYNRWDAPGHHLEGATAADPDDGFAVDGGDIARAALESSAGADREGEGDG